MNEAWKHWEGHIVNGEFRLRQYLGGSEDSAVFLTERGKPQPQKAAIKLIAADPASATLQLSRWALAAQLSHPHLIRLFHSGRCQLGNVELLFVVTEYAEENLAQVLPQRQLSPAEARDLLDPALDALAYLHGQGLVHGHLKPANIMAVNDQLKLSTDRLWRAGESTADAHKSGPYDPPERATGATSPVGDVWSLGMILVEALTKHLPLWKRTDQAEPALPQTLPAPLFEITRNCLRRDPQLRWTVAEIAARLHQISPQPQAPAAVTSLGKPARPRWIVPTVVAALVLAAILGGSRLLHRRSESEVRSPSAMEQAKPQPAPERKPETRATEPATQKAGDQPQASSGSPQPPGFPESEVQRKTNTRHPQGEVVQEVMPDVSASARATITGKVKVKVRVQVDAAGNVTAADFDSPGPSKYFARVALQAAKRWKFTPADASGQAASREWVLRFEFGRSGTKVFPARVAR
ncbi:MAG: TonB family protein [Acidobacteriia bacterium]|nr:TonB family protein [Terriglobia bacterium]